VGWGIQYAGKQDIMKQTKKAIVAGLAAAASIGMVGSAAHAQVFAESTDAGQTLPTADLTGAVSGLPLTTITGTFSSATDADLYEFQITSPTTFSASTNNTVTNLGGQDTALFLFSSSGVAIATNDDAPGGTTTDSTLPAGNALFTSLSAGTYYLGISESGNEPVNSANQLLFAGYPGGDTTAIRGPASGLNPTTEANFNSNTFPGGGSGAYEIDLTGSATVGVVPEPSSWAAVALGGVAAAFAFLRRRRPAV
jgi:hypothetical protein